MALLLYERGEDFEMLFADTGAELPENYWLLPRLARYVGKKLTVVSGGSFFQHLNEYGFFLPGPRSRWCTGVLKQIPEDHYLAAVGAEEACLGIRADEPERVHPDSKPREGNHHFIYPLNDAGMGKKDVKELCQKHGLLNPVYEWRSSVSCFCCFFQRVGDWHGLLQHHPNLFVVAEEWERQSMQNSKNYTFLKRHTLEALRRATKEQLSLWPEPEEEPCLICRL
jgi:3'-phosphoadenosine 5'-phosphosulfate sulfotransferase (PAPS reductase)/FAD synthetase